MDTNKIMLGVKEFATVAGLSEKHVRQICHIEGFPAMNSGVKILIHQASAREWLARYSENYRLSA